MFKLFLAFKKLVNVTVVALSSAKKIQKVQKRSRRPSYNFIQGRIKTPKSSRKDEKASKVISKEVQRQKENKKHKVKVSEKNKKHKVKVKKVTVRKRF